MKGKEGFNLVKSRRDHEFNSQKTQWKPPIVKQMKMLFDILSFPVFGLFAHFYGQMHLKKFIYISVSLFSPLLLCWYVKCDKKKVY